MKKQINNASPSARKLSLSKRTISNLTSTMMNSLIGGTKAGGTCGTKSNKCTQNQNTCPGHNTCDAC